MTSTLLSRTREDEIFTRGVEQFYFGTEQPQWLLTSRSLSSAANPWKRDYGQLTAHRDGYRCPAAAQLLAGGTTSASRGELRRLIAADQLNFAFVCPTCFPRTGPLKEQLAALFTSASHARRSTKAPLSTAALLNDHAPLLLTLALQPNPVQKAAGRIRVRRALSLVYTPAALRHRDADTLIGVSTDTHSDDIKLMELLTPSLGQLSYGPEAVCYDLRFAGVAQLNHHLRFYAVPAHWASRHARDVTVFGIADHHTRRCLTRLVPLQEGSYTEDEFVLSYRRRYTVESRFAHAMRAPTPARTAPARRAAAPLEKLKNFFRF